MRFSRLMGVAALSAMPALVPHMLAAQTATNPRPISVGVSGGLSLPIGDLGDAVDAGYNVTGHVWILPPSLTSLNFRGDVGWDSWKYKGVAGSSAVDGKFRSLSVTANALFKVPSSSGLHPYVIVGGGLYNGKTSIGGVSGDGDNNFGVQGGAGLEFALNGFGTFLEAKFVNVFSGSSNNCVADVSSSCGSSSSRYVPITFGIRF